jgi:Ser-tRNA(Ala) deacylase AlaX
MPAVGDEVRMEVDMAARSLNARLHSAGHLLDVAVQDLELRGWKAAKGYHFPSGTYVEYELQPDAVGVPVMTDEAAKAALVGKMQGQIDQLVKKGGKTICHVTGQAPGALNYKVQRTVEIGGLCIGCGGTHVEDVAEIRGVTIKGIQKKKKNMRVTYELCVPCA